MHLLCLGYFFFCLCALPFLVFYAEAGRGGGGQNFFTITYRDFQETIYILDNECQYYWIIISENKIKTSTQIIESLQNKSRYWKQFLLISPMKEDIFFKNYIVIPITWSLFRTNIYFCFLCYIKMQYIFFLVLINFCLVKQNEFLIFDNFIINHHFCYNM